MAPGAAARAAAADALTGTGKDPMPERVPVEMPVDPEARVQSTHAFRLRDRRRRPRNRDARERRKSVPTLASVLVRRSRIGSRRRRQRRPRRRDVRAVRKGRAAARVIARARGCSQGECRAVSCRAENFRWPNCGHSSIAQRCTSAATAGRCTSPPPARCRWSGCPDPRCRLARRRGGRRRGSQKRSKSRGSPAVRAISGNASRAISAAWPG